MSETFLQKCERKYNERQKKAHGAAKRNWTEEYQKRRVCWYNAIPEKGCITEQDHKELFPYGPSVYRDTKKDALNIYKQFIIHNKIASTYARDTTVQEKLI